MSRDTGEETCVSPVERLWSHGLGCVHRDRDSGYI